MGKISQTDFGGVFKLQVALVHDDLVQWGGAERILAGLSEIYPDAPIFTSVFDKTNKELYKRFAQKRVITSFIQKIPNWKKLYKAVLPLYPLAFEQFDFTNFNLVISQTTRFAKSIITKPETLHICYCHTPPRFLWHFSGMGNLRFREFLMTKLRLYDQVSASRADLFVAGSQTAAKRIYKVYRQKSRIIYPFVELERFSQIEVFDGKYYVVLGRANKYKRFDLAQIACQRLGKELKVIDGTFSDQQVIEILAGASALIMAGEEDFGISSLEVQALGKPVIAYAKGGALETIIDGKTGILFERQSPESLSRAIQKLEKNNINPDDCRKNAQNFSKNRFISQFKKLIATL